MTGSTTLFYALFLPVVAMQLICLLVLPAMLRGGANPDATGKAAYCYLAQSVGILLMCLGGLPALYAVLISQSLGGMMYVGLLLLFALGGIVFLAHDWMVRGVDASSRAVPEAIFFYTWKLLGLLAMLVGIAGLLLRLTSMVSSPDPRWWAFYAAVLGGGGLISWFTQLPLKRSSPAFRSTTMSLAPAAKATKPVAKKKRKSKK